jgi:multidrug efflux pump subunit AcrA (membrane-fusion protein)
MMDAPQSRWRTTLLPTLLNILRNRHTPVVTTLVAIVGILLGASSILYHLWRERPQLYSPSRVEVVKAQRHLYDAYRRLTRAAQLREEIRAAKSSLEDAASLLKQAERLDPSDKERIAEIRSGLRTLEDAEKTEKMTPEQLHHAYQQLSTQLSLLTRKLQ